MQKAVELALKISKELSSNWRDRLELINLHNDFDPIYKLGFPQAVSNTIVSFIILSYDNDSDWIDIRKDRIENLEKNLVSLHADPNNQIFKPILTGENKEVAEVIVNYLLNQADSRWQQVMSLFDYSSKMIRYCNSKTDSRQKIDTVKTGDTVEDIFEEYDIEVINKVNKSKGELLMKAIEARKQGEELLTQMKKDFVKVDSLTESEFDYTFTDVEKHDIYSWKQFVRKKNKRKAIPSS